jgi:hypothetical protein
MAMNGSSVQLFVYDKSSAETDKFILVGSQTSASLEESNEMIEASTKADGYMKSLYGRGEGSLSLELLLDQGDAGFKVLKNSFRQKKVAYVKLDGEYAEVLVESVSIEYPDNDVATASVEFKLNGVPSATVPTIDETKVVGSAG